MLVGRIYKPIIRQGGIILRVWGNNMDKYVRMNDKSLVWVENLKMCEGGHRLFYLF